MNFLFLIIFTVLKFFPISMVNFYNFLKLVF